MKRFAKSSLLGITLLEIMLVLAIAAMVIVMSVRYYQSASASQQTNSLLAQIQAITAIADGIAQSSGTYDKVDTASVAALMPGGKMTTAWGADITVTGSGSTYNVGISSMPTPVCTQYKPKLEANSRFTSVSCTGYTYDATK